MSAVYSSSIKKLNLIASQSLALVSCNVTLELGIPSKLPFFSATCEAKICGVTISSPKIGSGSCVGVPVEVIVKNLSVFSKPLESKLIKSSIALS